MKLEYKEDNGGESATYIPIKRKFPFELQVKLYSLKPVPRTKFSNDEIVQWDRIVHRYSIGISWSYAITAQSLHARRDLVEHIGNMRNEDIINQWVEFIKDSNKCWKETVMQFANIRAMPVDWKDQECNNSSHPLYGAIRNCPKVGMVQRWSLQDASSTISDTSISFQAYRTIPIVSVAWRTNSNWQIPLHPLPMPKHKRQRCKRRQCKQRRDSWRQLRRTKSLKRVWKADEERNSCGVGSLLRDAGVRKEGEPHSSPAFESWSG